MAQHTRKNPSMEWIEAVPIDQAEKAQRVEDRGLPDRRVCGIARDLKFQLCPSRDFHFGDEAQLPPGIELFHAPEIQGITHLKCLRISPTSPQSHTTGKQVEEAAQSPQKVGEVPAGVSPNTQDRCECHLGRNLDLNDPRIQKSGAKR